MSLASMSRGREIGVITTLLSIFGAVEARQMRALFSHLKDAQYAAIMSRMYREGLIWYGCGGKYIAISEHAAKYVDLDKSVMMCWAFISVKQLVREISSGDGPTLLTFMAKRSEYDLIYLDQYNHDEIRNNSPREGARIRRLFVVSDMSATDGLVFRSRYDYVLLVTDTGEVETYSL